MSYTSGTILSASPAQDLMAAYDTAIQAHAAWELVEQVISGTNVANVYRCLASVSGLSVDYYVVIRRASAAATSVSVYMGEAYDSATDTLSKMPLYILSSTTQATPNADGTSSTTYNVGTGTITGMPASYSLNYIPSISTPTTGFPYYLSVQNDCLVFYSSSSAGYAGPFVSLQTEANAPSPHLCLGTVGGSPQPFAVTRDVPSVASSYTWVCTPQVYPLFNTSLFIATKDTISNKWVAMPYGLGHSRGCGTTSPTPFGIRGYIPTSKFKYLAMNEFNEAPGDTVTIDGVVHTCLGQNVWVSQAA